MCLDRQILSLYYDGELPSPWKEKAETHLESCPECRAALARYRGLGENLKEPAGTSASEESVFAARERVWKKLTAPELVIPGNAVSLKPAKVVWKRSVTLPLPAAAAAALIIIAAFFALAGTRNENSPLAADSMAAAESIGLDDQGLVPLPTQDMSGVLKYLSSQDNGDFMIISLPESRSFSRTGEPALINAADYSRRSNPR